MANYPIPQFGQSVLRITQGPNGSTSHSNRQAIDFGGANYGAAGAVDAWKCLGCSWKVMYMQAGGDHFVYFQTTEPVLWANSTVDYAVVAFCHMNNTAGYRVGQVITPGQELYREGTYSGGRSGAVDPHIHCQVGKGKYVGTLQSKPYKLPNEARVEDLFAVPDSVKIVAGGGLNWRRVSHVQLDDEYNNQEQENDNVKLRLWASANETARTSALIDNPGERAMLKINGQRVLLKPVSAHEVTADTISATVDALEQNNQFVDGTYITVTEK